MLCASSAVILLLAGGCGQGDPGPALPRAVQAKLPTDAYTFIDRLCTQVRSIDDRRLKATAHRELRVTAAATAPRSKRGGQRSLPLHGQGRTGTTHNERPRPRPTRSKRLRDRNSRPHGMPRALPRDPAASVELTEPGRFVHHIGCISRPGRPAPATAQAQAPAPARLLGGGLLDRAEVDAARAARRCARRAPRTGSPRRIVAPLSVAAQDRALPR